MKKIVALMGLLTLGMGSAMAQESKSAIGVNLNYGTEYKTVGFGVKYQYNVWQDLNIEPTFNYWLKKDGISFWDIAVNFHYDFKVADQFKIYPLLGFGYADATYSGDGDDGGDGGYFVENKAPNTHISRASGDGEGSEVSGDGGSHFMVNIGAGAQYDFSDKWGVKLDLKYQIIKNFNQFAPTVGLVYKF